MEMQPELKKFAKRLNDTLYEKNLTASEVSQRSGISEASLSKYRNGQRMPQGQNLKSLANSLDVTVDYLVDNSEDKPKTKVGVIAYKSPVYKNGTIHTARYADLKAAQNVVKNLPNMDADSLRLISYLSDHLIEACKNNSELVDSIYNALELVIPQDDEQ